MSHLTVVRSPDQELDDLLVTGATALEPLIVEAWNVEGFTEALDELIVLLAGNAAARGLPISTVEEMLLSLPQDRKPEAARLMAILCGGAA